jgi:hypothetical protein
MTKTTVAFLAAAAAALLASCASAPRTPPLTIELFDSRAAAAIARAAPVPQPLSLPDVPGLAEPAAAPAAAPVAARLPKAGGAALDAGLSFPPRPRSRISFALAAPPAPAVQPVSAAVVPSPKPAPQLKKPAAPAAAAVPAPAASAAPAAPAPVPAAAAAGTPPAPSADASAAPYGRLREIYARQGDVLQVGLDGVGFLFLGFADAQASGMAFKTKENRNNKTWFTFQAVKMGTYDLDFLKQDNAAGRTAKETVRVHVVSDQDFNAAIAQQPGTDFQAPAAAGESADPAYAMKLSSLGSYQAAAAELLKGYKDGNPALNDQIAGLYMRMGSWDAAEKYYVKNLTPQNAFTTNAVVGLVRIAVVQNDQQGLLAALRQFLALKDSSMEEPLIQAVRMEKARSEIGMALDLAGEYVKRFPEGSWRDEADFLSAQLLEADSQFRDIARARDLYDGILSDHPESAFADAARQRVQYIDRHFYQVR